MLTQQYLEVNSSFSR